MKISGNNINLEHGAGGEITAKLINDIFLSSYNLSDSGKFNKKIKLTDSALIKTENCLISFTTDSYVVKPLFFPGGDIGKLSICGTVNDLAVSGAVPEKLSVSFIIEEGFSLSSLEKIVKSQAETALEAGVEIVCGDTKVVEKGGCDGLFINTSGIGSLDEKFRSISTADNIENGDIVIASGCIANHGTAVLAAREKLSFSSDVISDCAPLSSMIKEVLDEVPDIVFMRDATRGGIATVLTELSEMTGTGVEIDEEKIPVENQVRGLTELLGLDPLYLANEGTVIIVVKKGTEETALSVLRKNRYGKNSTVIGRIVNSYKGKTILNTYAGGSRILYRLTGQQLPRIC